MELKVSKSSNPLLNMTEALGHVEFQEGRPNESFESTSLKTL